MIGWAVGMISGTYMAYVNVSGGSTPFNSSTFPLHLGGLTIPGYAAFYSLILNFVVAGLLTLIFNAVGMARGTDKTTTGDYHEEPIAVPLMS